MSVLLAGGGSRFDRLVRDVLASGLVDRLHREADLGAIVDAQDLDVHLVAILDHVGDLGDATRRQRVYRLFFA